MLNIIKIIIFLFLVSLLFISVKTDGLFYRIENGEYIFEKTPIKDIDEPTEPLNIDDFYILPRIIDEPITIPENTNKNTEKYVPKAENDCENCVFGLG